MSSNVAVPWGGEGEGRSEEMGGWQTGSGLRCLYKLRGAVSPLKYASEKRKKEICASTLN